MKYRKKNVVIEALQWNGLKNSLDKKSVSWYYVFSWIYYFEKITTFLSGKIKL